MPPSITSKASEGETSYHALEDVSNHTLPRKSALQQKSHSAAQKRKRTATPEIPVAKKYRRRDHMIPSRSRPAFRDSPKLAQDASEADPESSDSGESFHSAVELQSEQESEESSAAGHLDLVRLQRSLGREIAVPQGSRLPSPLSSPSPPRTSQKVRKVTAKSGSQSDILEQHGSSQPEISRLDPEPPQGMPVVVKRLPRLQNVSIPANPTTFSKKQIISLMGGTKLGNHFWVAKKPKGIVDGYYLVDATETQPFAPGSPTQHGALISWRMYAADTTAENFPLFVNNGSGYMYFGHYFEPRFSDKICWNELATLIPEQVKKWAAKDICSKAYGGGKSKSAIIALQEQWATEFEEWYNEESKTFEPYDESKEEERGAPIIRHITENEAQAITYEELREAFERADTDEPVFRLYWEYLQCVGFDRDFYKSLKKRSREK